MSRAKRQESQNRPGRPQNPAERVGRRDIEHGVPDDRLLAKLAQLARFGLVAEAAPILAQADAEEP